MAMEKSCKSDIITRVIASVIIGLTAIFLVFVLGFNNSSQSDYFPSVLNNCSVNNFGALSPDSLKRSTNIFCGVTFGVIVLGICYQVFVIAGRLLKIGFISENNYRWGWIDILINSFLMFALIVTVAGSYMIAFLRNQYKGLFNDQLPNTKHFDVATGFLWAVFGIGISSIYQAFNVSLTMAGILAVKKSCEKVKSDNNDEIGLEPSKPQ